MSTIEELESAKLALMKLPVGELVNAYLGARKNIEDIERKHKDELSEPKEFLAVLESTLLDYLHVNNVKNLATPDGGKVYKSTRWSASIGDPEVFMQHVISTGSWELLDKKANLTASRAYLDEHKTEPPGVRLTPKVSLCAQVGRSKE